MTEPTHEQVADALDDAADLIERVGHYPTTIAGLCVVTAAMSGAAMSGAAGAPVRAAAYKALLQHVGVASGSPMVLPFQVGNWNDSHTEQEVLDALRGAAKAERRLADEATR